MFNCANTDSFISMNQPREMQMRITTQLCYKRLLRHVSSTMTLPRRSIRYNHSQPMPVVERSKVWFCVQSVAGVAGSKSRRRHGRLSLKNVVCCHVQVSATGRSLIQRSPTECHWGTQSRQSFIYIATYMSQLNVYRKLFVPLNPLLKLTRCNNGLY